MAQGRVYRRGVTWWIQYSVNGRQYRETARTTKKGEAEALLRERVQSVWDGRFFPSRRRNDLTVEAMVKMWTDERGAKKSIRHDKTRLAEFAEHFGGKRLISTITAEDMSAWRAAIAEGREVATVNRYLAVVRSALNLAHRRGYSHRDPMAGVTFGREVNARDRVCSPDEFKRLVAGCSGEMRAAVVVGYWTGMRLGEIVNLTSARLDLEGKQIRLPASSTKEHSLKTVPLPSDAAEALKGLTANKDGRLFARSSTSISKRFGELTADLGIVDLHFHDLRHTALTRMADAGVDIVTMAAISGHKTLAMLKRYVHRSPAALQAAMAKVEAHAQAAGREAS